MKLRPLSVEGVYYGKGTLTDGTTTVGILRPVVQQDCELEKSFPVCLVIQTWCVFSLCDLFYGWGFG